MEGHMAWRCWGMQSPCHSGACRILNFILKTRRTTEDFKTGSSRIRFTYIEDPSGFHEEGIEAGWLVVVRVEGRTIYLFIYYFLKINIFIYLFNLFWLRWVFVAARGLSLVVASGGYSLLWCAGFSLWWLLLLWSTGSRRTGFSSCSTRTQ